MMGKNSMFMDWKTIIKMAIVPKLIYRFTAVSIKIPLGFFMEINKLILKFVGNQEPQNS